VQFKTHLPILWLVVNTKQKILLQSTYYDSSHCVVLEYLKIRVNSCHLQVKVKVKAVPLQTLTDPEGSRRLRLPDFKKINT
jgi:hypothetical protein